MRITLPAAVLAVLLACPVRAKVSGPCANCHTMHNSQGGELVTDIPDVIIPGYGPIRRQLTSTNCVGCHSATDGSTWKDPVTGAPVVYNTAQPSYGADAGDGKKQGLAGGNFYFVEHVNDNRGHNVIYENPDDTLTEAPGTNPGATCGGSCHYGLWRYSSSGGPPTLYQGCTCCHARRAGTGAGGYHHADDSAGGVINDISQGGYRFIVGFHTSSYGIKVAWGVEDPDWEYTRSSTDHNEYMGVVGGMGFFFDIGKSISRFCEGCHHQMHNQNEDHPNSTGAWIRHPADQTIPATGEYASYTTYDPLIPVARPALSSVSGSVTPGTDMVTCLSCHRAHGSPYPDMLRFPYDGMQAGGGGADGTGCFKCHTEKDGS